MEQLAGLEGGAGAEETEDAAEDVRGGEVYASLLGKLSPGLLSHLPRTLAVVVADLELERLEAGELLDAHVVPPEPLDVAGRRGRRTQGAESGDSES